MDLKILFFGDVIGKIGRQGMKKVLAELKEEYQPDLVIANAENLAHGIGATPKTLQELMTAGVDFFTSGNHIWKKPEIIEELEKKEGKIIRPANFPPNLPGRGSQVLEIGTRKILIINLIGRVFLHENYDCPFRALDEILSSYKKQKLSAVIVDFHAEATSEKIAFGWYADGKVSAVLGTHTHVPTADFRVLPQGAAFISDIGMVGAYDSVIGEEKEVIIDSFLTQKPFNFVIPEQGSCQINAVLLTIDSKNKKAKNIIRVDKKVEIG